MSLVAYDYSDSDNEDSEEEESKSETKTEVVKKGVVVCNDDTVRNVESSSTDKTTIASVSAQISDDEEDAVQNDADGKKETDSTFLSLPAPKPKITDIDVDWRQLSKELTGKSQKVKIVLPSLSEIDDSSDEPVKKKLKPSKQGSGLFALLPNPKNGFIDQTQTLRRQQAIKQDRSRTIASRSEVKKAPLQIKKNELKSKNPAGLSVDYDSPEENEGDGDKQLDFFSLNSSSVPDVPVPEVDLEVPPMPMIKEDDKRIYPIKENNIDQKDQIQANDIYVEEAVPSSSSSFIPFSDDTLELDETAMQQLCGRKERQRGKGAGLQIIDVSGDAILPDAREWMTKQLTEEQNTIQSHKKKYGPTVQQKRKHQITYLAFQAKEHELELKNQWANNRMSRKQTQAKYGF